MKELAKIVVLLDKSGSMGHNAAKTVEGFNEFVASQETEENNATISLYQFANELEETYLNLHLKSKQPKRLQLSKYNFSLKDYTTTNNYFSYLTNGISTALRDGESFYIENKLL